MLVQMLLHSLEELFDVAIDYPLQLHYPSFGQGQLLSQLHNGTLSLGDLVHQVIHVGLYLVPL